MASGSGPKSTSFQKKTKNQIFFSGYFLNFWWEIKNKIQRFLALKKYFFLEKLIIFSKKNKIFFEGINQQFLSKNSYLWCGYSKVAQIAVMSKLLRHMKTDVQH